MSTDRDAQPDRPFTHSGGARPIAPSRPAIPEWQRGDSDVWPDEDEAELGREQIEAARAVLKNIQPPQPLPRSDS